MDDDDGSHLEPGTDSVEPPSVRNVASRQDVLEAGGHAVLELVVQAHLLRLDVQVRVQGLDDTEPVPPVALAGMEVTPHLGEPVDQVRLGDSLPVLGRVLEPLAEDRRSMGGLAGQRLGRGQECLDLGLFGVLVHPLQRHTLEQKGHLGRAEPSAFELQGHTIPC